MKRNRQNLNVASMDTSGIFLGPVGGRMKYRRSITLSQNFGSFPWLPLIFLDINSSPLLTASNELLETIINYLKRVQKVEKIIFQKTDEILRIWSVLSEYENEENRKSVYHQEKLLMKELVSRKYQFDFYIIEKNKADEILSSGAILIFDRHDQDTIDDVESPLMPARNQFIINLIIDRIEKGSPSLCDEEDQ